MTTPPDEELVEGAAMAAGIEGRWVAYFEHLGLCISEQGSPLKVWWNPLTDDGDALRLAARLERDVKADFWSRVFALRPGMDFMCDPNSATRRAIVRAAYELSKGMK